MFNPPREVSDLDQCFWYHDMDLPGVGRVRGLCDMSVGYQFSIETIPMQGRTVLEIGPASGAYTFAMEARGADVTSVELSPSDSWDIVPHAGQVADLTDHLEALQNSYWLAHKALGSKARVYPGTVYGIDPKTLGTFDIATIHAVLVHLRDPLGAITNVARHCRDTLVITEAEPFSHRRSLTPLRLVSRGFRFMTYQPAAADRENNHTWWKISPALIAEHCRVLGFKDIRIGYFRADFHPHKVPMYCLVARR